MKYKIVRGSLKAEKVYVTGDVVELKEKYADVLLREGVIEIIKKAEPVKEEKKVTEPEKKKEETAVVTKNEPSDEWTRKELNDYALAHGVVEPEKFASKTALLTAIKGGEIK